MWYVCMMYVCMYACMHACMHVHWHVCVGTHAFMSSMYVTYGCNVRDVGRHRFGSFLVHILFLLLFFTSALPFLVVLSISYFH